MPRYVLVDALAWEVSICTVLFESNDLTLVLEQKERLSTAMSQPLGVLDSYRTEIPASRKPMFRSVAEINDWLRTHQRSKSVDPKR